MRTGRPTHSSSRSQTFPPSWHHLHENYPRRTVLYTVAIAIFLLADLILIAKHLQYLREQPKRLASMDQADLLRTESVEQTERNLAERRMLLGRRQAMLARGPHLSIDCSRGVMYLQHDRAILREMPVRLGSALTAATPDGSLQVPLKRSRRILAGENGQVTAPAAPLPGTAAAPEGAAAAAGSDPLPVFLEGGIAIYPLPEDGALSGGRYPPDAIEVARSDLEAIRETLHPGMRVYFY
ncbi:hypothetical protein L4X63_19845 [Geomonas sp. Red32]|uniref:hypothetical protein n=1 Tax=Geomonas sp. Red32 TaxID=2912856 RepID=UPI00202CBB40|nr:hypothetical protein [Geomonas sp. Red32]MCM0083843.1 hypothetical protein [Geomonas sp. Red32]